MAVVRKISNQSREYYQCRNPVEGIALNHAYKSIKSLVFSPMPFYGYELSFKVAI